jgi:hypothetical protein
VDTLSEALRFNPHWIIDPAVWRIIEEGDQEKLTAVANIQLEFTKATLAAHMRAVESIQQTLAR